MTTWGTSRVRSQCASRAPGGSDAFHAVVDARCCAFARPDLDRPEGRLPDLAVMVAGVGHRVGQPRYHRVGRGELAAVRDARRATQCHAGGRRGAVVAGGRHRQYTGGPAAGSQDRSMGRLGRDLARRCSRCGVVGPSRGSRQGERPAGSHVRRAAVLRCATLAVRERTHMPR